MIEVSVVVSAHNEERLLERCLVSLMNQTFSRESYEVVVVNNASTDKTKEIAQKYANEVVDEPRLGLLFARQTGFEAAQGKILIRTDADVVVPRDWVERAWNNFQNDPQIVALTGFYFPDNDHILIVIISWISIFLRAFFYRLTGSIGWMTGCCSAFKKEIFDRSGGFDLSSDAVIEDQQGIGYKINKFGKVGFDKNWWVRVSTRRVKCRIQQGPRSLMGDYLIYQGLNNLYFFIFKKKPPKIFGKRWSWNHSSFKND